MSETLIKVSKGQTSKSFALDTSEKLSETRTILSEPPNSFMTEADDFLNDGSPIQRSAESLIALSAISGEENAISIGSGADIGGDDGVQRYNRMSEASKRALFDNIQIRRGLTVDNTGFKKTFKNLYDWKNSRLPEANMPRVLTEVEQHFTFTKDTFTLETSGVQSGSISLTAPFGDAKANYKYAQEHKESTSTTTEYMTQRYLSKKVDLNVPVAYLEANLEFLAAVKNAIKDREDSIDGYEALANVLNDWGWYIPLQYTLGGVLYATKHTSIKEYSEADSESQTFGGEFKAAFDGIGGGSAYENSSGTKSESSSTDKETNVQILQIGGLAGTSNSFTDWNKSLNEAITWNTASFQKLYPSLMLLAGVENETLSSAIYLLQRYNSYKQVADLQPYINVSDYELTLSELLNPF